MVTFRLLSNLADEEVGAKTATWDLCNGKSSFKVIPQLLELHGFGVVSTKVIKNGHMFEWRSFAEILVWMSSSDGQQKMRQLTFGGSCSRGRSDVPLSNRPWVAIFTLSVWQSHHRKFLVITGVQSRKMPFLAIDPNLAG